MKTDANPDQISMAVYDYRICLDVVEIIHKRIYQLQANLRMGFTERKYDEGERIEGGSKGIPYHRRVDSGYDVEAAIERWQTLADVLEAGGSWTIGPDKEAE